VPVALSVDEVIPEPDGGAHLSPKAAAKGLGEALDRHLGELEALEPDELVRQRREKYYEMGEWREIAGG